MWSDEQIKMLYYIEPRYLYKYLQGSPEYVYGDRRIFPWYWNPVPYVFLDVGGRKVYRFKEIEMNIKGLV